MSEKSEGQPEVPATTSAPVVSSAPGSTVTASAVTEKSEGQPEAPAATTSPVPFTGAAVANKPAIAALAGLMAFMAWA